MWWTSKAGFIVHTQLPLVPPVALLARLLAISFSIRAASSIQQSTAGLEKVGLDVFICDRTSRTRIGCRVLPQSCSVPVYRSRRNRQALDREPQAPNCVTAPYLAVFCRNRNELLSIARLTLLLGAWRFTRRSDSPRKPSIQRKPFQRSRVLVDDVRISER